MNYSHNCSNIISMCYLILLKIADLNKIYTVSKSHQKNLIAHRF